MKYRTVETALRQPVNYERSAASVSHYTNGKFYAAVFRFGTWSFPTIENGKPRDPSERMEELADTHIGFAVREMDDRNFVVKFTEHLFSVVIADEFRAVQAQIEVEAEREHEEIILGKKDAPKEHGYIGLFARTRLLRDIAEKEVVAWINPRPLGPSK